MGMEEGVIACIPHRSRVEVLGEEENRESGWGLSIEGRGGGSTR